MPRLRTSDDSAARHRAVWAGKPVLREIYFDLYRRIAPHCRTGAVVEIGGGSGNFKAFVPEVVSVDVRHLPWLDLVADAHCLPFADGRIDTIVMFDVLHHLARPRRFFEQAERALRLGGRVVLVEPAMTPLGGLFYRLLHHEPVRMDVDPLGDEALSSDDPGDSNQAIASLIFGRDRARFSALFPRLRLVEKSFASLWAYPLSGGFQPWSLLPARLAPPLLKLESALLPALGRLAGFRLLVVLEKT